MNERFRRRRLPHWDIPGVTYFATTCLEGSLPSEGLLRLRQERETLERQPRPDGVSPREWKDRCWKKHFAQTDDWLDIHPAVRHLADGRLADEVIKGLAHFADVRYELISFVVMPSHLHWVFRPLANWTERIIDGRRSPREIIMHSVNRHTAARCNQLLARSGIFWQHESYDHVVRDEDELERIVNYIHQNPVKAGLVQTAEEWPFSSAYGRGAGLQPANAKKFDLDSAG